MKNNNTINGNFNIVGDHNVQNVTITSSNISEEIVKLIEKLAVGKEKESLMADLSLVKEDTADPQEKITASGRLAKFLKTVGGAAGKVVLSELVKSGLKWAHLIPVLAESFPDVA